MSSLLDDLRKLDVESYQGYDRTILKHALSLLEIIANDRQTRMTFDEFTQLPAQLEYSEGFVEPKHWPPDSVLKERRVALARQRIASSLREFVRERGIGSVAVEGTAIVVRGLTPPSGKKDGENGGQDEDGLWPTGRKETP